MVALHKDNSIYHIPDGLNKQQNTLNKFYCEKFEDLFKSKNISYKLIDYENYDGEFYIGRFAHALPDKKLHSKCFDKLYNHYGEIVLSLILYRNQSQGPCSLFYNGCLQI